MFRVTWNKTGNATVYSNAVQAPWNREHNTSLIFESFSLVTGRVRAKQVCIIASGGALNTWAISSVHGVRKQKSVGKSAFMRLILFVRALLYNKLIPRGIWTHQSLHFLSLWLKTQWTVKWPVGITVKPLVKFVDRGDLYWFRSLTILRWVTFESQRKWNFSVNFIISRMPGVWQK